LVNPAPALTPILIELVPCVDVPAKYPIDIAPLDWVILPALSPIATALAD
jgi:hypothetical protein